MNSEAITTGAYVGSEMHTTNLEKYREIIRTDFETEHILKHAIFLANEIKNTYESNGEWLESDIELMNECMVFGSNIYRNVLHASNLANYQVSDSSQLALFRLKHDEIVGKNFRKSFWLRDVATSTRFSMCHRLGLCNYFKCNYIVWS